MKRLYKFAIDTLWSQTETTKRDDIHFCLVLSVFCTGYIKYVSKPSTLNQPFFIVFMIL